MGLLEPHGRYRGRDGEAALTAAAGRLIGIARKPRPKAAMVPIEAAAVGPGFGIEGDCRGTPRPGGSTRRQVTVMALADWRAALGELGLDLFWALRRANLLVDGDPLPRQKGARIGVGDAVFEVTGECDPCRRMDDIAPGLRAALTPDWRGGRLLRVVAGGTIAVGDVITFLEP